VVVGAPSLDGVTAIVLPLSSVVVVVIAPVFASVAVTVVVGPVSLKPVLAIMSFVVLSASAATCGVTVVPETPLAPELLVKKNLTAMVNAVTNSTAHTHGGGMAIISC
jgi:hypothetical protein